MRRTAIAVLVSLTLASVATAQNGDISRTPSGRPDLSGSYDVSTLTPMERPEDLGEKMALTEEEAAAIAERMRQGMAAANRDCSSRRTPLRSTRMATSTPPKPTRDRGSRNS